MLRLIVFTAMLLVAGSSLCPALAGAADGDAAALLEKTGVKGGICLVVGAKDTELARALAAKSALYVQVLQADAKVAAQWGAEFAKSDFKEREKLGVRCAAFDAEHYGTNLFNLVVVEDSAALGKATPADLCRILVPGGSVALRTAPDGFAAEAGKLKMEASAAGAFAAVFKKPPEAVDWKVCDSLKWRAGPRAQYCGSFSEIDSKNGQFSYLERMEVPGDVAASRAQLFVRDAWNGRTLRTEELPADRKVDWYAVRVGQKIAPFKPAPKTPCVGKGTAKGWKSYQDQPDGKLELTHWGNGCYPPFQLGKYVVYHNNIWIDLETKERTYPYFAHPACFFGHFPANNLIYNFPSRKNGVLAGVSAIGPADIKFDHEPGGKVLQKFAAVAPGEATTDADWPMFRGGPARGNASKAALGDKPAVAWESQVSLGGRTFGAMCGQRTGLTQPVAAWGLVIVSDIDAGRIVALSLADGKERWAFHVGSRVDFSPTLYKGLCLFTAKDGFVYCLDAKTGQLAWRLLVSPRERYVGGQEQIENLWPTVSDVMIADGVGYASAGFGFSLQGGARAVAFKPETGEVIWGQCYFAELNPMGEGQGRASIFTWVPGGFPLAMGGAGIDTATGKLTNREMRGRVCPSDDYLAYGNSLSRTNEDRAADVLSDGRLAGRTLAFDAGLSVAYTTSWGAASWEAVSNKNVPVRLHLSAASEPKKTLWQSEPVELVVDDIVLTPQRIYCVGHYQRVKKDPELWVLSREDGKVVNTVPVGGFPAFLGTSAAGNRLLVATREGKLICFENK